MKATEVTADLAESNGSLLPGLWRDSLHVTCGLTACTAGSAPGPTLGNEYGKTLPFLNALNNNNNNDDDDDDDVHRHAASSQLVPDHHISRAHAQPRAPGGTWPRPVCDLLAGRLGEVDWQGRCQSLSASLSDN